jgi:uncharacterized membrane protein
MMNSTKGKIIKGTALAIDVISPLVATLTQFPAWVEQSSSATVSGLFLLFALVSVLPFINQIKEWLKSPSVTVLWCVFFVLVALLRNIIDQMWVICLVGAISNGVGSIIYKVGDSVGAKTGTTESGGQSV